MTLFVVKVLIIKNIYMERNNKDDYTIIPVSEFIENDESLEGVKGY